MPIEKEELVHVFDTINCVDTSIKIQKGRFPRDTKYPEYVEIHQLEGKIPTLTEFDQKADSDMDVKNYLIMSPEDAVELYRALGIVLGIIG